MRPIRSVTTTALAMAVLAATVAVTGCTSGAEATTEVFIAADLELSGASAPLGKAYKQALELKVEQINKSGALGNRRIRLEVRDNKSDPGQSLQNVNELIGNSPVDALIMGGCNECATGAAQIVNDRKVPTIALAPAAAVTTPVRDRRYVFKLAPSAEDSAAALATELKRQAVQKVAVLHSDDAYGREGFKALKAEFSKAAMTLTGTQTVRVTDTAANLSGAMNELAEKSPKAIVVWAPTDKAMLAATAAKAAGHQGSLLFDASAAGPQFLDSAAAGPAEELKSTLVFTQTMAIDDLIATTPARAARMQWFRDYTARFGSYHGFSSFAADSLQLLSAAIEKTGDVEGAARRDGIRDSLETAQIDGLSGPIQMTVGDHSGLMPQALTPLVARGGRWRLTD